MLWKDINGRISETPSIPWDDTWLSKVDWQTLHILKGAVFEPITITTAQVLQQIGCQHAARQKKICIDYPWMLQKKGVLQKKEMKSAIEMSQINLTLRADYLIKGLKPLEAALEIAA
ncbi:MAG: hypothetical protein KKE12_11305, partial [Proteobacteria bacterium]|nr:hypothetical protein [Pseudomonadota bacterium]